MIEPTVFLNGAFIPASQASLKIYDLGVVSGATFTEMTRTFRGAPFRVDDHLARLYASLEYGGISISISPEEMRERILELIARNFPLLENGQDLAVVCFVTAGENSIYAGRAEQSPSFVPTICIHSFPLRFVNYQHFFSQGAHVVTPEVRHVPPQCLNPQSKHRSRLHWFLADQQARKIDPNALPLLLDLQGNISESTGANFLIRKERTIFSPTPRNILQGVSLQTVREIAAQLNIELIEKDLQVEDVVEADEAWLSSTPYCIAPCTRINNLSIGDGKIGPVFREILEFWNQRVGINIPAQIMAATY